MGGTGDECNDGVSEVMTISGVTELESTVGDNFNYPNPPAWGLSYHLNGQESPVLEVLSTKVLLALC